VKLLKLQMTAEQIQAMVAEADADGSGEVEFDEFVLVLRKQMEGGGAGGAFSNVVSEVGSMFGWLNPLSWFVTTQPAVPDTPSAPVTPAKTPPGTAKSHGPVPSLSPQQGPLLSPSPRWTPTVTATSTPTGTPSSKARSGIASRSARKRLTVDREADLRAKLRPIFDNLDEDQSGTVSVAEMGKMVKLLKLQMTAEQIQTMVAEADADGSGEVEFDEFVLVLRKQMEGGGAGGAMSNMVGEASSAFGWLNPLSWFTESPAAAPPRSRASPIHRYGGGEWSFKRVRWSPPDAERSHTPQNAWLGWGSKKSNVLAQESLWRGLPPQPQFQAPSSPIIPSIRYAGTGP